MRDLWFEHGDLERIIREPSGVWGWVQQRLADALHLGSRDAVPSRAARQKLLIAGLHAADEPLLEGDEMTHRLHDALAGMAPAEQPERTLMPPHHLLELFVTVTDHHGYARALPIADPPVVAK